jgi:hypothetical protein
MMAEGGHRSTAHKKHSASHCRGRIKLTRWIYAVRSWCAVPLRSYCAAIRLELGDFEIAFFYRQAPRAYTNTNKRAGYCPKPSTTLGAPPASFGSAKRSSTSLATALSDPPPVPGRRPGMPSEIERYTACRRSHVTVMWPSTPARRAMLRLSPRRCRRPHRHRHSQL